METAKHQVFFPRCAIVVEKADVFTLPQPDPAKYPVLPPEMMG